MSEYEYITAFGYDPTRHNGGVIRERIVRCRDCRMFGDCEWNYENEPMGFCSWGYVLKEGGDD